MMLKDSNGYPVGLPTLAGPVALTGTGTSRTLSQLYATAGKTLGSSTIQIDIIVPNGVLVNWDYAAAGATSGSPVLSGDTYTQTDVSSKLSSLSLLFGNGSVIWIVEKG
jgi:hypothetical protein